MLQLCALTEVMFPAAYETRLAQLNSIYIYFYNMPLVLHELQWEHIVRAHGVKIGHHAELFKYIFHSLICMTTY